MKYTDEEKKIIDEVKKYLRELRLINIEKFSLTFEIEDIPSPQSIKYSDEAPGGFSKPKGEQITSNMLRRELFSFAKNNVAVLTAVYINKKMEVVT